MAFFSPDMEFLPTAPTIPSTPSTNVKNEPSQFFNTSWLQSPQYPEFAAVDSPLGDIGPATPTSINFPVLEDGFRAECLSKQIIAASLTTKDIDSRARDLFRAFMNCDKFFRYRNGNKKNKESDVWSDQIEEAFFKALVRHPASARYQVKPQYPGDEKLGRNQCIARFIKQHTGEPRLRKQVSSHLQTLRGYVAEDPLLLGYLIQPKAVREWHRKLEKEGLPLYPVSWEGIQFGTNVGDDSLIGLETRQLGQGSKGYGYKSWILGEFEMSLCTRNAETGDLSSPLHTYCLSTADSQRSDVTIDRPSQCFEILPELYQHNHSRPISGQVIAIEATLELPRIMKMSEDGELAIYLSMQGPRVSGNPVVDTVTTFYQWGGEIQKQERLGEYRHASPTDELAALYQIPFCSSFWADTLARLGSQHQRAVQEADYLSSIPFDMRRRLSRQMPADIHSASDELANLTAVQQITIYSSTSPSESHTATLRWQFRATSDPHGPSQAHVAWRLVHLPPLLPTTMDDDAFLTPLPSPTETLLTADLSPSPLTATQQHYPLPSYLHSPVALHPPHQPTWNPCFSGGPTPATVAAYPFTATSASPSPLPSCLADPLSVSAFGLLDARLLPDAGSWGGVVGGEPLDPWLAAQGAGGGTAAAGFGDAVGEFLKG